MHKATFLEGTLRMTITPDGPILIKAGESGGADPTLPDMRFVRTQGHVYIPGPSLKGVVRAQAERICRSMDSEEQQHTRYLHRKKIDIQDRAQLENRETLTSKDREELSPPDDIPTPLADNPLGAGTEYDSINDITFSSGRYIESLKRKEGRGKQFDNHPQRTAIVYRRSSFVSQIFGHTSLAGRVRFADAYSDDFKDEYLEERNGVAIDRIYGSVAVGPFNYETAVSGTFTTQINFKNLTLAQLALLGLALRDLADGRIAIGFGKSRGLGRVNVMFDHMELYYPTCELLDTELRLLNKQSVASANELAGLGALCGDGAYDGYALPIPEEDRAPLPDGLSYTEDDFLGVRLVAQGDEQVRSIWRTCMPVWKQVIGL